MPTAQQIREACRLLGWSLQDLQRMTALPFDVVERVLTTTDGSEVTLDQEVTVGDALLRAGVVFIETGGEGSGIYLRKVEP